MNHHKPRIEDYFLTRRDFLSRCGMGLGGLSLASIMGAAGLNTPAARADGFV